MMAVKRFSLLALATMLQCAAHGSHEEGECKSKLEGLYYNVTDQGNISIRVTVDSEHMHFRGTYDDDADKRGFIGRIMSNCKGEMIMDGNPERVTFELYKNTLSFSDRQHWTRKGFEVNSDDYRNVYYFGGSHRVATTVAVMFLFLFLMGVLGIGLVRWPDANIRKYTWELVDRAMTVFIAVLINNVMVTIIIDQVIAGKQNRGLNWDKSWWNKARFTAGYTILAWTAMNFVTWYNKKDRRWRTGAGKLGAHIVGFAALSTAESFMRFFDEDHEHEGGTPEWTVVTGVLALFGWFVMKKVWVRIRDTWTEDTDDKVKLAKEQLDDSEGEARVLVESFLCAVLTVQMIIGHLPHPEKAEMSASEKNIKYILIAAGFAGGLGLLFRLVQQQLDKKDERASAQDQKPRSVITMFDFVVELTSKGSSWLFYFGGLWTTQLIFARFDAFDTKLVKVVNAFAVTLLGGVAMLVVEYGAKVVGGEGETTVVGGERESSPIGGESQPMIGPTISAKLRNKDAATGMRIFLESLGIFIALSWEQAFHSTEEITAEFITEDCEWNHTVLTKFIVAAPFIIFSLPLWVTFVVPNADKEVEQHKKEILRRKLVVQAYREGKENAEEDVAKVV